MTDHHLQLATMAAPMGPIPVLRKLRSAKMRLTFASWALLWLSGADIFFHFAASIEEECAMGPDGTCLTEDATTAAALDTATPTALGDLVETSYGEKQRISGPQAEETRVRIDEIITYMKDRVFGDTSKDNRVLQSVASECKMRNELCAFWAAIGECQANPGRSACVVKRGALGDVLAPDPHFCLLSLLPDSLYAAPMRSGVLFVRTAGV
jgi:hypothetical protein